MTDENQTSDASTGRGWLAAGGVLSGAFAMLGASCCVLLIILVNLGISSALVANLAILAHAREALMLLTVLLLVAGVVVARRSGRRPCRGFWIALGVGFIFLAAAWILPQHERELLQWIHQS